VTDLATKAPISGMKCSSAASQSGAAAAFDLSTSQGTTDAQGNFSMTAPGGSAVVMCMSSDPHMSDAGAVVEVSPVASTHVSLVAVRAVPPFGDAGFDLLPSQFPATVRAVDRSGPAAAAGLQVGDQLVAVGDTPIAGLAPSGAMNLVRSHPPGTVVAMTVMRAGHSLTMNIAVR
jgi:S1-C subfamily serine protease